MSDAFNYHDIRRSKMLEIIKNAPDVTKDDVSPDLHGSAGSQPSQEDIEKMEQLYKRMQNASPEELEKFYKDLENAAALEQSQQQSDRLNLPGGKSAIGANGVVDIVKGLTIDPTAGFVLKTKREKGDMKVFVNICQHVKLGAPSIKTRLSEDGEPVEGMNIPMSVGIGRTGQDKAGVECYIYDIIVNPKVVEEANSDHTGKYKDFVCQLAIHSLEQKYKELLDKRYKLPKLNQIGVLLAQQIRDVASMPKIEEISKTNTKKKSSASSAIVKNELHMVPDSDLLCEMRWTSQYKRSVSSQDIRNMPSIQVVSNEYVEPSVFPIKYDGIIITSEIARKAVNDIKKIDIEVSAYSIKIAIPSCKPTLLYFPCVVISSSAECSIHEIEGVVTKAAVRIHVKVEVAPIEAFPDPGSKLWLLSEALRDDKPESSDKKVQNTATKSSASSIVDDTLKEESIVDKFHINAKYNMDHYVGVSGTSSIDNDEELPEDRFHRKDAASTYIISQREQSIKEKADKHEAEKSERKDDPNVEYIDVDDFKPGGKYANKSTAPISDSSAGSADEAHSLNLKRAAAVIADLTPKDSALSGLLSSNMWTELL